MLDLSVHVLDIAENSIRAGANLISIQLIDENKNHQRTLVIEDNGKGMNLQMLEKVSHPFFTTRTTRRVGLGIALLKQNCEQSGGTLLIESKENQGTKVVATMAYDHIDCLPIGDMTRTLLTLMGANPAIDWIYHRQQEDSSFELDTRQIKTILQNVPINHPEILKWLADYIVTQENKLFNTNH